MAERTIDAGLFTAYGYAKAGGYSGTVEDFMNDLASVEAIPDIQEALEKLPELPYDNGGYYLDMYEDEATYQPMTDIVPSNPSADGQYDLTATAFHGVVTRSWTARRSLPAPPSNDGTYALSCVVSNGTPTISWTEAIMYSQLLAETWGTN